MKKTKHLAVWSALMLALSLCGGVREDLQSARTFEADYRSGKIDAAFAAGSGAIPVWKRHWVKAQTSRARSSG